MTLLNHVHVSNMDLGRGQTYRNCSWTNLGRLGQRENFDGNLPFFDKFLFLTTFPIISLFYKNRLPPIPPILFNIL